jgi:hypothetical protein
MSISEIPEWKVPDVVSNKSSPLSDFAMQLFLEGHRQDRPVAGVEQALIYTSPDGTCPAGHTKINSTTYKDGLAHRTVKCDDGATKELSSPG